MQMIPSWKKTYQGVGGEVFNGLKPNSAIFLPAAGVYWENYRTTGSVGDYWTSTLVENQDAPVNAYDLIFHSDSENYSPNCYWQVFSRENGMSVRPVCNIVDD